MLCGTNMAGQTHLSCVFVDVFFPGQIDFNEKNVAFVGLQSWEAAEESIQYFLFRHGYQRTIRSLRYDIMNFHQKMVLLFLQSQTKITYEALESSHVKAHRRFRGGCWAWLHAIT